MDAPETLVELRPFRDYDLALYAEWQQQMALDAFMSRIYPRAAAEGFPRDDRLLAWYVIEVSRQAVGTVWLEKDAVGGDRARLGILIAQDSLWGRGIGTQAVCQAVTMAREQLGLSTIRLGVRQSNRRAIRCYEKCGFVIVDEGTKVHPDGHDIPWFEMEQRLNAS